MTAAVTVNTEGLVPDALQLLVVLLALAQRLAAMRRTDEDHAVPAVTGWIEDSLPARAVLTEITTSRHTSVSRGRSRKLLPIVWNAPVTSARSW